MTNAKKQIEAQLIALLRQFLKELKSQRVAFYVTLEANLEKDLGIGSLEKAELLNRIEKQFSIQLSEKSFAETKTLNDLLILIQQAKPLAWKMSREFSPILSAANVDLSQTSSLVDVLESYVRADPSRPHVCLQDELGAEETITYGQLFEFASHVASGLSQHGLQPGDTVAIMLPTSIDFFYAFFGILLAGCIPVPIYPPFRPDQIEEYIQREAGILNNAEVQLLITFSRAETLSRLLKEFIPSLRKVTTVSHLSVSQGTAPNYLIGENNPALIQYTSGSTGTPKGVLLTHYNLLTNIRAYSQTINLKSTDVCVSWLPLYHDMGLIGAWLGCFYRGIPLTLLSPLTFLTRPERWLWAMHYHRGTIAAAPNFAYELCVRKIDEAAIEGLDLSAWRIAACGAETIYPKTLIQFYKKFSPYGLKQEALFPAYGLAECTVALTLSSVGHVFRTDIVARESFERKQLAVPASTTEKHSLEFVSCGKPIVGHEIRIIDAGGNELDERQVGSLQFKGPSAMQGYYRNPEATKAVFHDGWWDTGDLAYVADGELFITGRQKDVIIKAGRNFYPDTVEQVVAEITGVRKGCVAAFGVGDVKQATEKFIIVAETQEQKTQFKQEMTASIIKKAMAVVGVPPDEVILAHPNAIPKTSSGKLRRSSCKQAYLAGKLATHPAAPWRQLTKLFFVSIGKKLKRWLYTGMQFLYGVYIVLVLSLHLPFFYFSVLLSSQRVARKLCHYYARWLFLICGCPIRTTGKQHLSEASPAVFVANHASYIDAGVLLAVLPSDITFIGKKELLKVPILRTLMRKLNYIAVDRYDFVKSQKDVADLNEMLNIGKSIALFPEGTFTYATGLRPFKAGAFKVAVDAGLPVCPVALRGTRRILRADTWLPRLGMIHVTIGKPIKPQQTDWSEVMRLHEAAHQEIAKYCGEQSLDLIVAGPSQE